MPESLNMKLFKFWLKYLYIPKGLSSSKKKRLLILGLILIKNKIFESMIGTNKILSVWGEILES